MNFNRTVNSIHDADDEPIPFSGEPTIDEPVATIHAPVVKPVTGEPRKYPLGLRQPPSYLNDYKVDAESTDVVKYVDYCYCIKTPVTYEDALSCPEANQWKLAMDNEFEMLQLNDTFVLTELPTNKSIVGGRWVYHLKVLVIKLVM